MTKRELIEALKDVPDEARLFVQSTWEEAQENRLFYFSMITGKGANDFSYPKRFSVAWK